MPPVKSKEHVLWEWLKRGVPRLTCPKHVHRVEDTTKSGTPDVEACVDGAQFWMELKVARQNDRVPRVGVTTTVHQVYFALRRVRAGGRSWYLIRVGTHPDMRHYLIWGAHAEHLMDAPVAIDWLEAHSCCDPKADAAAILMAARQAF